jgi:hypothetical protein
MKVESLSPLLPNLGQTLIFRPLKQRKHVQNSQSDKRGIYVYCHLLLILNCNSFIIINLIRFQLTLPPLKHQDSSFSALAISSLVFTAESGLRLIEPIP